MKFNSLAFTALALYVALMRVLTLVAFFALQLSVFTCGFDIHVHAMDSDVGHIAQHAHDKTSEHEQAPDHGCHIHTSHTFVEVATAQMTTGTMVAFEQPHILKDAQLKNLSDNIEYPPKA